ncbi:NUDIX domain-containing protein [Streptomyces klenkii]|uniref:NUDIX domain-containing protein n=1 Tax=Streptomyces klenkii TaxID=1420899 RepID=UPI003441B2FC
MTRCSTSAGRPPRGRPDPERCAQRELREEAGITTAQWRPLGADAIPLETTARVRLCEGASSPPDRGT